MSTDVPTSDRTINQHSAHLNGSFLSALHLHPILFASVLFVSQLLDRRQRQGKRSLSSLMGSSIPRPRQITPTNPRRSRGTRRYPVGAQRVPQSSLATGLYRHAALARRRSNKHLRLRDDPSQRPRGRSRKDKPNHPDTRCLPRRMAELRLTVAQRMPATRRLLVDTTTTDMTVGNVQRPE